MVVSNGTGRRPRVRDVTGLRQNDVTWIFENFYGVAGQARGGKDKRTDRLNQEGFLGSLPQANHKVDSSMRVVATSVATSRWKL
jgi:hypothetical protein